ncbi:hypothetical protein K469DRAFT_577255, partial [Zopfia rhizophila CBS 207.26]
LCPTMAISHEFDLPTRAAIVTLRFEGRGWTYISEKLASCSPSGVQHFFDRVLERSQCDPDNLYLSTLLKYLEDKSNRGRQECFIEGSVVEEALVKTATLDLDYEDMSWRQIIHDVED